MSNEPRWVQEARRYIGMKEIKGPKHEPRIIKMWQDIKRGGIKDDETAWCFPGETEILTENGWIRFDALGNERVFQADINCSLSLSECEKIRKKYNGDVFNINHRSIRMTCDVGHRWWGRWGKKNRLEFNTLDSMSVDGLSIPSVSSSSLGCGMTDDQLCLLAAFICDGKHKYSNGKNNKSPWSIEFEVSKNRKIDVLNRLSPDHVYVQKKAYGPLTKEPLTVFRFKFPNFFDKCFCDYKRLKKEFICSMSAAEARKFLHHYSMFDGNNHSSKTILYTSSKLMADDLVMISVLAGYHMSVQYKESSGIAMRETYCLAFSKHKKTRSIDKSHVSRSVYSGQLYCVRVPEGRIVVRGSETSAPVVVGNCAAFTGACLENSGIESSRFESAKSYLKWGIGIPNPVVGCIVVFGRDGGGHVGFVLGTDKSGNLVVLGGNQSKDSVSIAPFEVSRALAYRWPAGEPMPAGALPVLAAGVKLSQNEA